MLSCAWAYLVEGAYLDKVSDICAIRPLYVFARVNVGLLNLLCRLEVISLSYGLGRGAKEDG